MDLQSLHIFVKVVEAGNFTRASEQLLMTQPNVSLHIKQLEQSFHTKLLDRSPKYVRLTGSGQILYERAQQMLSLYKKMTDEMHDYHNELHGSLTIAASYTIGEYLLPGILTAFHRTYPEIQITVNIDNTERVCHAVKVLKADIGLIEGQTNERDLAISSLTEDRMLLVASSSHHIVKHSEITSDLLQNLSWVGREKGSGTGEYMAQFLSSYGIRQESHTTISSNQGIKEAVGKGLGLSVLSELVVNASLKSGELTKLPFPEAEMKRILSYIVPLNGDQSKVSQTFLAFIKSYF